MMINWDEAIEAVCLDGTVVPVTLSHGYDDTFVTNECPDSARTNNEWHSDGADWCSYKEWRIRNVATNPNPQTALEALERYEAWFEKAKVYWQGVDKDAFSRITMVGDMVKKLGAIVADLPVDPDMLEAREIAAKDAERVGAGSTAAEYRSGKYDSGLTGGIYAGVKRGRELERGEV